MPKVPKRKTRVTVSSREQSSGSQPYRRKASTNVTKPVESSLQTGNEQVATSSEAVIKAEGKPSKRRKRGKNRRSDVESTTEALTASPPTTSPAQPLPATPPLSYEHKSKKERRKALEPIPDQDTSVPISQDNAPSVVSKSRDTAASKALEASAHLKRSSQARVLENKHLQELHEMKSKYKEAVASSGRVQDAMEERIHALETLLHERENEARDYKAELEAQGELLRGRDTKLADVTEALSCGVCFEPLRDPHLLQCGHTACRHCLLQWFRSPNAYPSDDITHVLETDDLKYRTKVCHLCREKVLRRPVRIFGFNNAIEHLRTDGKVTADPLRTDTDMWDLTFPAEPTEYLFRDEEDDTMRCAACGHEVAFGVCCNCEASYSYYTSNDEIDPFSSEDDPDLEDDGEDTLETGDYGDDDHEANRQRATIVDLCSGSEASDYDQDYDDNNHDVYELHGDTREEHDNSSDSGYESSFINDEPATDEESAGGGSVDEEDEEGEVDDDMAADLSMDELRRRRIQALTADPPANRNPSPDADDEVRFPTRPETRSRRQRIIELSDSD